MDNNQPNSKLTYALNGCIFMRLPLKDRVRELCKNMASRRKPKSTYNFKIPSKCCSNDIIGVFAMNVRSACKQKSNLRYEIAMKQIKW